VVNEFSSDLIAESGFRNILASVAIFVGLSFPGERFVKKFSNVMVPFGMAIESAEVRKFGVMADGARGEGRGGLSLGCGMPYVGEMEGCNNN